MKVKLGVLWYNITLNKVHQPWQIGNLLQKVRQIRNEGKIEKSMAYAACIYQHDRVFELLAQSSFATEFLKDLAQLLAPKEALQLIQSPIFKKVFIPYHKAEVVLEEIMKQHQAAEVRKALEELLVKCRCEQDKRKKSLHFYSQEVIKLQPPELPAPRKVQSDGDFRKKLQKVPPVKTKQLSNFERVQKIALTPLSRMIAYRRFFDESPHKQETPREISPRRALDVVWLPPDYSRQNYKNGLYCPPTPK